MYCRQLSYRLCVLLTLMLSFWQVKAQQDTIVLKEVAVASRQTLQEAMLAPLSIDSISLSSASSSNIAEALAAHSTLHVKSYGRGSEATVSFRGSAASHTALQWNEIPLNSPMRGYADFSLFPTFFIDNLSLSSGANALSDYGGALGGLVKATSEFNWKHRHAFKYQQIVESFNTYKEYALAEWGNSQWRSQSRLFHEQSQNNFPFYNSGVLPNRKDVQKNADYRQYGAMQSFAFKISDRQMLELQAWYLFNHRNLPQLMSFEGKHRVEFQDNKDRGIRAAWKYYGKKGSWKVSAAYKGHQLHYYRSSMQQIVVHFDTHSQEHSFFQYIDYTRQISESARWHSQIRAAHHQVEIDNQKPLMQEMYCRNALSILQQIDKAFGTKLSGYALLRFDVDKGYSPVLSPAVGAAYQLLPQHKLIAGLSHNYHKPTLNDLYWVPGGNPLLKPEKAYAAELAWQYEYIHQNLYIKVRLNGFVSSTEDWIVWHPAANGAYYWEADNLKKVLAKGIELYAQAKWHISSQWQAFGNMNYTYGHTTNQEAFSSHDVSRGKQLIYIPRQRANALVQLQWESIYTQLNMEYTGLRYTTSSNQISAYGKHLEPYALAHSELGYAFAYKGWKALFALNIHNIFNTNYMSILWRPMPGRYYSFKIQLSCLN